MSIKLQIITFSDAKTYLPDMEEELEVWKQELSMAPFQYLLAL